MRKKLKESDNQIQILQNELKYLTEKVESVQEQLEASNLGEKDLLERLRYAQEQLADQGKTVEEITANNLDLNSLTESLAKDSELKLQDAASSLKQKDSEANELNEKLLSIETQLRIYERQVSESATQRDELEGALFKIEDLEGLIEQLKNNANSFQTENEGLVRQNTNLSEDLGTRKTNMNDLLVAFDATIAEKEDLLKQLHSLKKESDDFMQMHKSERDQLKLQVSSLAEESTLLKETYEKLPEYHVASRHDRWWSLNPATSPNRSSQLHIPSFDWGSFASLLPNVALHIAGKS